MPHELRAFDYVFHIDASSLNGYKPRKLVVPNRPQIESLIDMYPSTCLFLLRHPDRTTVYQEIKETMKLVSSINDPSNGHSFENRTAGRLWYSHLQWQGFKDTWPMVETRMFLRRVHGCADVDEALGAIFDKLMERGLHRDQNVITVVAPPYLPHSLQRERVKVLRQNLWFANCSAQRARQIVYRR